MPKGGSAVLTLRVSPELFNPTHASVAICPISSDCVDASLFRPRGAISREIGQCEAAELEAVDDGLRRWLALG
jgi:hypothetical protein